jgi:MerR family mercuric resistance operon transcriptional regulator
VRIGELARLAGIPASTIRYYEAERLLPAPPRLGGRRDYARDALDRLELVAVARSAGFTIREIRELVTASAGGRRVSAAWHARAHAKLEELGLRLAQIERAREELRAILACGCETLAGCRLLARRRPPGTAGSPPLRRGPG